MRSDKHEQDCRRADPRSAMDCPALAFRAGGRRSEVTVSDMSLNGFQIKGASFADNDEFRLVIPHRGDINARVQWATSSTAGARFDENLLLADVVPAREMYAVKRLRAVNFGSGRVFGKCGNPA